MQSIARCLSLGQMLCGLLMVWVCTWATPAAGEPPFPSTWESLPDRALLAWRIPAGAEVVERLRGRTKLGGVLFSDVRIAALRKQMQVLDAWKASDLVTQLADLDLEEEGYTQLFSGECGVAVLRPAEGDWRHDAFAVTWLTPGQQLAGKLWQIVDQITDRHEDEDTLRRLDLTLADRDVIQLMWANTTLDYTADFELPDDYDELSEEEQELAYDRASEAFDEGIVEVTIWSTTLVTRLDGELLAVHSLDGVAEDDQPEQAERLGAELVSLVDAHQRQDDGFIARVERGAAGAADVDSGATLLTELVVNPAAAIEIAQEDEQDEQDQDADGDAQDQRVWRMLGVEQLGPVVLRMVLDEQALRTSVVVSAPAPRAGLMRLFDQKPLSVDPPAWVPTSAVGFAQLSFDLAEAYRIVKQETTAAFPEQAGTVFAMAETQVEAVAGVGLEEVLASLGTRHLSINLPPEMVVADPDIDPLGQLQERTALVWRVDDEPLWGRLFQTLGSLGAGLGLEPTQEQGFRGYRAEIDGVEGGLVLGSGYLVGAYGRGVLETVLATINNPPQGGGRLSDGRLMRRAAELIELRPGVSFELTDGDTYFRSLRDALALLLDEADPEDFLDDDDDDEDDESYEAELAARRRWLKVARQWLPTTEETRDLLGVVVTQFWIDDDGLWLESVNELPPP